MYTQQWTQLLADYPLVLTPTYAHARNYEGREGAEEIMLKGFYSFAMNYMGLPAITTQFSKPSLTACAAGKLVTIVNALCKSEQNWSSRNTREDQLIG